MAKKAARDANGKVIKNAQLVFGPLTPKQELFMTAETKYVGYGGARGGGKSRSKSCS